ncbi:SxtJ family membrane protein [Tenacibaculum ovolyticum]|uniref:SxtJ family membrane protein n=1 Tax=Tenacibaculum ovolyticum TaxID=104270 RepID=UPI00374CC93B
MNSIKNTLKSVIENTSQRNKQRQFGWLLMVICFVILFFSLKKEGFYFDVLQKKISIAISIIALITLLVPKLFYPFLFIWLLLGDFLGLISSFILLSIIYYLFLTPIVFFGRLKHKCKAGWITKEESSNYEKLY